MDALKIQAHHTHQAQLADALRRMNSKEDNSTENLLEDISPELVPQKVPSSFNELNPPIKKTPMYFLLQE